MRRRLIILGNSGLAREMAMVAEHVNAREHRWELYGFISESTADVGKNLGVAPVLGDDAWLLSQDFEADLVVGIGYPKVRARVLAPYLRQGDRFSYPNLIHPNATLDYRRIELGHGNVITAGCAFTCDIEVQDFNLFNLNVTVGHDARIGSFNIFNPGTNISGGVYVCNCVFVGTGCQMLENVSIGSNAVIGAGALVRRNVLEGQTVVGVPARPIERSG